MPRYVALLRGINVGGKNLIRMPALTAAFEAAGFEDVSTYIQSGNVLFSSPSRSAKRLTEEIEAMLAASFDYLPTVVVRSERQLRDVVAKAPRGFGSEPDAYLYDVIFLKEPLTTAKALREVRTNPAVDTSAAGPGVLYFSRLITKATASRLNSIVASPIYASVTIRNWNTTMKLLGLLDAAR